MKRIALILWLTASGLVQATPPWESDYASLLRRYVTPEGVRYDAWKKSPADLEKLAELTRLIGEHSFPSRPSEETKAFLINAYNLWVLHGVLQVYPIRSVQEVAPAFGFFSENRIRLEGQPASLNDLEKKRLLAVYRDPRIHFALNCASRSCPPLAGAPFTSKEMESQLDRVTKSFLASSPHGVPPAGGDGPVRVSSIFDWYRTDFEPVGGVLQFLNRYRQPPFPQSTQFSYLEYDWSLNETR